MNGEMVGAHQLVLAVIFLATHGTIQFNGEGRVVLQQEVPQRKRQRMV